MLRKLAEVSISHHTAAVSEGAGGSASLCFPEFVFDFHTVCLCVTP